MLPVEEDLSLTSLQTGWPPQHTDQHGLTAMQHSDLSTLSVQALWWNQPLKVHSIHLVPLLQLVLMLVMAGLMMNLVREALGILTSPLCGRNSKMIGVCVSLCMCVCESVHVCVCESVCVCPCACVCVCPCACVCVSSCV